MRFPHLCFGSFTPSPALPQKYTILISIHSSHDAYRSLSDIEMVLMNKNQFKITPLEMYVRCRYFGLTY